MADDQPDLLESLTESLLKEADRRARVVKPMPMAGLSQIGIRARRVAEAMLSGQHQSNQFGQNIEFSDYREYVPGDDLRHVDWRAYGRSDRLYIKRFEAETAIRAVVTLDVSKSMLYGHGEQQKIQYGAEMAAAIATLLILQKDSVGLALYDEELSFWLAPAATPEQLRRVYNALENCRPQRKTLTGSTLHFIAQHLHRRGLLILISDFWDNVDETLKGLSHFALRGFEVLVFHILTREEADFPFLGSLEIEGLEDPEVLETDGRSIRDAYRKRLGEHRETLKAGCFKLGLDYSPVITDEPPHRALLRVLSRRRQLTT
jgi:uncharacterized protein (DUF58 family)